MAMEVVVMVAVAEGAAGEEEGVTQEDDWDLTQKAATYLANMLQDDRQ